MSTILGDILVRYKGDVSDLSSKVKQAKSDISSMSDSTSKASGSIKSMGDAAKEASGGLGGMVKDALSNAASQGIYTAVGSAVGFLKDQFMGCFQESEDAQAGMALTNSVLKSTHDASGMSAQGVADLAGNLSHLTMFSDDTTQAAENMLLTFTNIGKNVFPQATKTVLDMSQALGQDTKSSAIQLGKALNDPIQGITALSRVGVTFTQGQKDSIKAMMDAGNTAGAQGVILQELQREFGGAAEAAGKTLPGQLTILKQHFADVKQSIGDMLMPSLMGLVGFANSSIQPAFDKIGGAVQYVGNIFKSLNLTDFKQLWQSIGQEIGSIAQHFSGLGGILSEVGTDADPIANILGNLAHGTLDVLTGILSGISGGLMSVDQSLQGVSNPLSTVAGLLGGAFKIGLDTIKGVWTAIAPGLLQTASILGGQFKTDLQWVGTTFLQIAGWAKANLLPAIAQLEPPIISLAGTFATTILPALAQLYAIGHQVAEAILTPLIGLLENILPPAIGFAAILMNGIAAALQIVAPLALGLVSVIGDLVNFFTKTEVGGDLVKATLIAMAIPVGILTLGFIALAVEGIAGFIMGIPAMITGFIAGAAGAWSMAAGVIALTWPILVVIAVIAAIILIITHWGQIMSWLGGVAGVVGAWVGSVFSGLGSFLHGVIGNIGSAFSGFGTLMSSIWSGVINTVKGAINAIIGGINWFIGWIDGIQIHIPSVSIGPIQTPSFNWNGLGIPRIPYLAQGGFAQGWFVAGEQGPELGFAGNSGVQIYSNSKSKSMLGSQQASYPIRPNVASVAMATGASSGATGSASGDHTTIIELDSEEMARHIQPATDRLARLKLGSRVRAA